MTLTVVTMKEVKELDSEEIKGTNETAINYQFFLPITFRNLSQFFAATLTQLLFAWIMRFLLLNTGKQRKQSSTLTPPTRKTYLSTGINPGSNSIQDGEDFWGQFVDLSDETR